MKRKFGRELAKIWRDLGVTQTEMALRTGYTQSYLSMVANDQRIPSMKFVERVAYALNMSLAEVLILIAANTIVGEAKGGQEKSSEQYTILWEGHTAGTNAIQTVPLGDAQGVQVEEGGAPHPGGPVEEEVLLEGE